MAAKRSKIREVDVPYVWCSAKMVARNTSSVVGICGSNAEILFEFYYLNKYIGTFYGPFLYVVFVFWFIYLIQFNYDFH